MLQCGTKPASCKDAALKIVALQLVKDIHQKCFPDDNDEIQGNEQCEASNSLPTGCPASQERFHGKGTNSPENISSVQEYVALAIKDHGCLMGSLNPTFTNVFSINS
eukprot:gnl/MRDRNA2_/MRDRNA2_83566_c0_seq1.p2 gnl/MRDRNA2_/MRDRNA2_83566_c0~~gnl/MRDRNA2_/MRDRNA2_83566_c0_seq1.p2  ORF type:complete len:107 (+),score=20.46 gnl/MRDRNA2_/MRDRNA2_83566_c0_seq1:306-626(+)